MHRSIVYALSALTALLLLAGCYQPTGNFSVRGTVLAANTGQPIATEVVALGESGVLDRVDVREDGSFRLVGTAERDESVEILAVATDTYAGDAQFITGLGQFTVDLRPRVLPAATEVALPAGTFSQRVTTSEGIEVFFDRAPDADAGSAAELEVRVETSQGVTRDASQIPLFNMMIGIEATEVTSASLTPAAPRFSDGVMVTVRVPITAGELTSMNNAYYYATNPLAAQSVAWLDERGAKVLNRTTLEELETSEEVRSLDPETELYISFSFLLNNYLDAHNAYRGYQPFVMAYPPSDTQCFVGRVQGPNGPVRGESVTITVNSENSDYSYDLVGLKTTSLGLLTLDLSQPSEFDNTVADLGKLEVTTASGAFSRSPVTPVPPTNAAGCGSLGIIRVEEAPTAPVRTFSILAMRDGAPAPLVAVTVDDLGIDSEMKARSCEQSSSGCNTVRVFTGPDGTAEYVTAVREGAKATVIATLPPSEGGGGTRITTLEDEVTITLPPRKETSVSVELSPGTEILSDEVPTFLLDVRRYDGAQAASLNSGQVQSSYLKFMSLLVINTDSNAPGPVMYMIADPNARYSSDTVRIVGDGILYEELPWRWVPEEPLDPGSYKLVVAAYTFGDDFSDEAEVPFTVIDSSGAGELTINVSGLPEGVDANLVLESYPEGYERTITETTTLRGLAIDTTYIVTANQVQDGSTLYTPDGSILEAYLSEAEPSSTLNVTYSAP